MSLRLSSSTTEGKRDRCTRACLEGGQALMPIVLFLAIAMVGLLAFAIDVGYIFHEKRLAQSAADAAAIAAAEEYTYDNNVLGTDSTNAADAAAAQNGFDPNAAIDPATVTVTTAGTGNYSSEGSGGAPSSWVVATVSKPIPTFFMAGFDAKFSTMTVSATAEAAGKQDSPTCVCLEGTSGNDLNMSNGSHLSTTGCGLMANSNSSNAISIVGGANLCASSIGAGSNWDNSNNVNNGGGVCSSAEVVQSSSSLCSPPMPAAPSSIPTCVNDPTGGNWGTFTVGPTSSTGVVCYNSLSVGANGATVTLNPGVYVINGGELHFESGANNQSNLGGNGVFFYLENGASLAVDNGANVNLVAGGNAENGGGTAPDVGTNAEYDGIAVYQAATDTKSVSFQGGSSTYFNGALYAPGAAITLGNGSGAFVQSDIVGQSLTDNGGGTIDVNPITNLGTNNTSTAKLTQ